MVKTIFKNLAEQGGFHLVNKKVIVPHYTEVMRNKAARSAKLRVCEKLPNPCTGNTEEQSDKRERDL